MSFLELKIPPPLVALGVGLVMWLASLNRVPFELPDMLRVGMALVLAVVGIGLAVAAVISFGRAKTTVNPIKPASTSSLVTSGVYRISRNPIYFGDLLVLLAWATYLANGLAFVIAPVFVLYINRFQIIPEERALSAKFGGEFFAYKAQVRRWL